MHAPQVAQWAGRGVDVLLRICAKCIDGQHEIAKRRIIKALRDDGTQALVDFAEAAAEVGHEDGIS